MRVPMGETSFFVPLGLVRPMCVYQWAWWFFVPFGWFFAAFGTKFATFCLILGILGHFWSKNVSQSVDCNAPYGLMVICYWITQSHPRLFRKHRELVAFDRFCVPKNDPKVTRKWPKSGQFSGWITGNWLRLIFKTNCLDFLDNRGQNA